MNFSDVPKEYMIYGTLFTLSNRIQTLGDQSLKSITLKQHFLLVGISMFTDKHPSLKEVADLIGCTYQNVKRMAASLEKDGYLRIEADPVDRRRLNLILTDKVGELAKETNQDGDNFLKQMFRNINSDHLEITLKTLLLMEQNLKANDMEGEPYEK